MQSLAKIEVHNRRWSHISLLYRVEQITHQNHNLARTQGTFPLRRRSDYFYINQPQSNRFILLPDSMYRELWELLSIFLIMFQQFSISYSLSFTTNILNFHYYLLIVCDLFFSIEIFSNLNTAYFSEGTLIKIRSKIMSRYIKEGFLVDFIACFPFELIVPNMKFESVSDTSLAEHDYIKALWLLKCLNIFKLPNIIYNLQCKFTSQLVYTLFHIAKFLISGILLIHWTACMMYFCFLKDLESNGAKWNYIYDSGANPYLRYFYMIVFTMTTTGYGDITPFSLNQKILAIVIMALSCWLFAFILTNSKEILIKYTSQGEYYKEVIFNLKKYLKTKKIPRRLRLRTISYLQFLKANFEKKSLKENEILDLLSPTLREDVLIKTRGKLIQRFSFFKNYSMDFIRMIIRELNLSIFAPNDLIFKEGDRTNSLFFVLDGKVEIYHESTRTVFVELGKKEYFGEIAFFLDRVRSCSARSLIFSELLYLQKEDMDRTLRKRPKEIENHRMLIAIARTNLKIIGIKCYLCGVYGHIAKNCKKFVIQINKTEIAKKAVDKSYNFNKAMTSVCIPHTKPVNLTDRYEKRNSVGIPSSANFFTQNKNLRKMCKEYISQLHKSSYKLRIKKMNFYESCSEEVINEAERSTSILPENLQYSSIYLARKSLKLSSSFESLNSPNSNNEIIFSFGPQ